jgi:HlyD family secretion protein
MSASMDIFTHVAAGTLTVPIIAVTARDDDEKDKKADDTAPENAKKEGDKDVIKEIVFIVTGDTVAVREVKTGIQDNDHIEIVSGLQEGETVVTGPYSAIARKLKSGSRINITDKKSNANKEKKSGVSVEID